MEYVKTNYERVITENAIYTYVEEKNALIVKILHSSKLNIYDLIEDLNYQISLRNPEKIVIGNIKDEKTLNWIFSASELIKGNVTLDVSKGVGNLFNDTVLITNFIKSNVKIKTYSSKDYLESEFITWLHNQDESVKAQMLNKLDNNSRKKFLEEEVIIEDFYKKIIEVNPEFDNYSKFAQFSLAFEYVKSIKDTFTDTYNKEDSNPIDVYKNSKGNSFGKSRLLKLLTNNRRINIDSYTVMGNLNEGSGSLTEWNVLLDDNKLYHFDTTYYIKALPSINRSLKKADSKVIDYVTKEEFSPRY